MKFKVRAIVEFVWEEDTENWRDDPTVGKTAPSKEEALKEIKKYIPTDILYLIDNKMKILKVEEV